DTNVARHTPGQTAIDAVEEAIERRTPVLGPHLAGEAVDALVGEHHVSREHQREEEVEDAARHVGDDVATDGEELDRVLLRVADRLVEGVAERALAGEAARI